MLNPTGESVAVRFALNFTRVEGTGLNRCSWIATENVSNKNKFQMKVINKLSL